MDPQEECRFECHRYYYVMIALSEYLKQGEEAVLSTFARHFDRDLLCGITHQSDVWVRSGTSMRDGWDLYCRVCQSAS